MNQEEDYIDDAFEGSDISDEVDQGVERALAAGRGIQNDLVDKEVAKVTSKDTKKHVTGGYALPDDEDDEDEDEDDMDEEIEEEEVEEADAIEVDDDDDDIEQ